MSEISDAYAFVRAQNAKCYEGNPDLPKFEDLPAADWCYRVIKCGGLIDIAEREYQSEMLGNLIDRALRKNETMKNEHDSINHPTHYTSSPATCAHCGAKIECIDVTRHMNFNLGNVVKYLWRLDLKGGIEDLKKAAWYLSDEIARRQKETK